MVSGLGYDRATYLLAYLSYLDLPTYLPTYLLTYLPWGTSRYFVASSAMLAMLAYGVRYDIFLYLQCKFVIFNLPVCIGNYKYQVRHCMIFENFPSPTSVQGSLKRSFSRRTQCYLSCNIFINFMVHKKVNVAFGMNLHYDNYYDYIIYFHQVFHHILCLTDVIWESIFSKNLIKTFL